MDNNAIKMFPVPLSFVLRESYNFSIFIKIGSKFVALTHQSLLEKDRLENLQQNKLSQVFLNDADFKKYIALKNKHLEKKAQLMEHPHLNQIIDLYSDYLKLVRETFLVIGIEKEQLEVLSSLKNFSLSLTQNQEIGSFLKQFEETSEKNNLIKTYLETQLTILLLKKEFSLSLEDLSAIQTILLIKDVFELDQADNVFHGTLILNKLTSLGFPLTKVGKDLVLNHHEEPGGSGLPKNIHFDDFDCPSAIYFLSRELSNKIVSNHFKSAYFNDSIKAVIKENIKYISAINFNRAIKIFSDNLLKQGFSLE